MESTKSLPEKTGHSLTFAQRLRSVRERYGKTLEAFASSIGYNKGYISLLEGGKAKNPSLEFIEAVCAKYLVSRPWLEKGEGDSIDVAKLKESMLTLDYSAIFSHLP